MLPPSPAVRSTPRGWGLTRPQVYTRMLKEPIRFAHCKGWVQNATYRGEADAGVASFCLPEAPKNSENTP
ncbi:hypothetical protein N7478_006906 [Penicillium angulare]|uniref:uncharacterized protein n=1 Tax=Penicillium angulare TaxID=116970 RepID=UPI002540B233|nr:uncharacterized protein N7478_006906 [Penicillium angulare]KAJ5281534.1 hypothetical protein N7478_006906 [Penicillium angulare]